MRLKDISFLERHLEKFILAATTLFVLLVAWFFWLSSPYSIPQTEGGRLRPQDVEKRLLSAALELQGKVNSTALPFERPQIPDYSADFNRTREGLLVRAERFVPFSGPGLAMDTGVGPGDTSEIVYELAQRPAPSPPRARADFAVLQNREQMMRQMIDLDTPTLGEEQARQSAQAAADFYDRIVDPAPPRDFAYVGVVAEFDLGAYYQAYADLPQAKRVPEGWQRASMYVTDVSLERQTFDPVKQQWSDAQPIALLPRALTYRNIPEGAASDQAMGWIAAIVQQQDQITQQAFAPVTDARPPVDPDANIEQLNGPQLEAWWRLTQDIQRLEKRIRAMGGDVANRPPSQPPAPGPEWDAPPLPAGEPGALPPGAAAGPRTRPLPPREPGAIAADRPSDQEQIQQRVAPLLEQLRAKQEERAAIEGRKPRPDAGGIDSIRGLDGFESPPIPGGPGAGAVPPGYAGAAPPRGPGGVAPPRPLPYDRPRPAPGADPALPPDAPRELEPVTGKLRLLAYDITAVPEATYRYRLRVLVRNPLYKQPQLSRLQAAEFKERFSLDSPWSNWSEPVTVAPTQRFFFTESPRKGVAKVELYKLANGRFRRAEVEVRPGDPLRGSLRVNDADYAGDLSISFPVVAVDVVQDAAAPGSINAAGLRFLYQALQSNTLLQRHAEADRNSPDRTRLLIELQEPAAAAAARGQ